MTLNWMDAEFDWWKIEDAVVGDPEVPPDPDLVQGVGRAGVIPDLEAGKIRTHLQCICMKKNRDSVTVTQFCADLL